MKKTLKVGLLAFVAGQVAALFYKDKEFRQKFESAQGFDKCKVLFNELLELNKKLFLDAKSVDYSQKLEEVKSRFEQEINKLQQKIEEIKQNYNQFSQEKLQPILTDLKQKAEQLKEQVDNQVISIKEKYQLEEKLASVMEKIKSLRKES
jgi:DNA anti-recombination protein RmuC